MAKSSKSKSRKTDSHRTKKRTRVEREDSSEQEEPILGHTELQRKEAALRHLARQENVMKEQQSQLRERDDQLKDRDEKINRLEALLAARGINLDVGFLRRRFILLKLTHSRTLIWKTLLTDPHLCRRSPRRS